MQFDTEGGKRSMFGRKRDDASILLDLNAETNLSFVSIVAFFNMFAVGLLLAFAGGMLFAVRTVEDHGIRFLAYGMIVLTFVAFITSLLIQNETRK